MKILKNWKINAHSKIFKNEDGKIFEVIYSKIFNLECWNITIFFYQVEPMILTGVIWSARTAWFSLVVWS